MGATGWAATVRLSGNCPGTIRKPSRIFAKLFQNEVMHRKLFKNEGMYLKLLQNGGMYWKLFQNEGMYKTYSKIEECIKKYSKMKKCLLLGMADGAYTWWAGTVRLSRNYPGTIRKPRLAARGWQGWTLNCSKINQ